jgi:uncharacterized protein with HEPN domain
MIDAAEKAIKALQTVSLPEFLANYDMRDLAVYRLQVIGEAANQISETLQNKHPEVPWREIVDKRNVLIHGYNRVDYQRVWNVVRNELPPLVLLLDRILKLLDSGRA